MDNPDPTPLDPKPDAPDPGARPVHTPYADGVIPFSIGLAPIEEADWIEPEPDFALQLGEKERLLRESRSLVFAEEPGSRAAQAETLALLAAHLPARHPALYRAEPGAITIPSLARRVALDATEPPLLQAARLVPEDLLLMARDGRDGASGWRLVAGALCFPSSWSLAEKFGRPLDIIHERVPGFGPGSRNASVIDRVFERLRPGQRVARYNWSIYGDARLDQPVSKHDGPRIFAAERIVATPHVRVERQTLFKLPETGEILFTVRIHVDGLKTLARHPEAARLAAGLADRLAGLSEAEIAYKSLTQARDPLLARLREIAGRPTEQRHP